MEKYVKSVLYLLIASAAGYGLLELSQNSNLSQKYTEVDKSAVEDSRKGTQFMTVLKAAASTDQPIYRLNQKEVKALLENERNTRKE